MLQEKLFGRYCTCARNAFLMNIRYMHEGQSMKRTKSVSFFKTVITFAALLNVLVVSGLVFWVVVGFSCNSSWSLLSLIRIHVHAIMILQ